METARSYQGLNEEIKYDKKLYRERKRALTSDGDVDEPPIKNAKEHTERSPTAENIEISSDSDPELSGKKSVKVGLRFLVEEMEKDGDASTGSTSSTSDEEFVPEAEQHPSKKDLSQEDQFIIPPSPVPAYTAKSVLRKDRSLEIEASETIEEQRANEDSAALEEESEEDLADQDYNYEDEDEDEDGEDDAEIDNEFETWKSYYQRGQGKTVIAQLLLFFSTSSNY